MSQKKRNKKYSVNIANFSTQFLGIRRKHFFFTFLEYRYLLRVYKKNNRKITSRTYFNQITFATGKWIPTYVSIWLQSSSWNVVRRRKIYNKHRCKTIITPVAPSFNSESKITTVVKNVKVVEKKTI